MGRTPVHVNLVEDRNFLFVQLDPQLVGDSFGRGAADSTSPTTFELYTAMASSVHCEGLCATGLLSLQTTPPDLQSLH